MLCYASKSNEVINVESGPYWECIGKCCDSAERSHEYTPNGIRA